MPKRYLIVIVFLILLGIAAGYILISQPLGDKPMGRIPQPERRIGEEILIVVIAGYEDATPVQGVSVSFVEKEAGLTVIKVTDKYGQVEVLLKVGSTYEVSATLGNSTKSTTFTVVPWQEVGILISPHNTIERIIYEEASVHEL